MNSLFSLFRGLDIGYIGAEKLTRKGKGGEIFNSHVSTVLESGGTFFVEKECSPN